MSSLPTPPDPVSSLAAQQSVYQVNTEYSCTCGCNPCECGAVIAGESVAPGSVIIAPPGSQACLTPGATTEGASSGATAAAAAAASACAAGHAARVVSSGFLAPTKGGVFTFSSPCASAWAAANLYLWFPGYGWVKVVAANNEAITAENISIAEGTSVGVGVGFHIAAPSEFLVAQALQTLLCESCDSDEDLPVFSTAIGCDPDTGVLRKGRIPEVPSDFLVRKFLDVQVIDHEALRNDNLVTIASGTVDCAANGVPAGATHVCIRGWWDANLGSTANCKMMLLMGTVLTAQEVGILDLGADAKEAQIAYGELILPIESGRVVPWRVNALVVGSPANPAGNMTLKGWLTGYLIPVAETLT